MNNIYKVIWSKAKNCYVVASEIARSHTKSASGSEKIGGVARHALLALGVACAIACGGFVNVGAAVQRETISPTGTTSNPVLTASNPDDDAHLNTVISVVREDKLVTKDNIAGQLTDYAKASDLSAKADANDVYSKTAAEDKFATKTELGSYAKSADVYSQTDADGKFATNDALNDLKDTVNGKADKSYVDTEVGKKANKATTLGGYGITDAYTKGEVYKKDEVYNRGEVARKLDTKANQKDLNQATDRITKNETAINGLTTKTTEISYADGEGTKISGVTIKDGNIVGNGNSAITQLANVETDKIETDSINGKSLTGTTVATEKEVKDVADAVKTETDERKAADTALEGKITKNSQDIATLDVKVTTAQGDIQTNANNIHANSNAIADTNDRTGGIARNLEDTQTTIEGSVKVDNKGNVKDVNELSAKKITTTEDADLKGDVTLGTPNGTNTVTVNGTANFHEEVKMNNGLNVTNGETNLKKTTVDGDLKVTGTITTDKMVFGVKPTNYTEIDQGKVTSKNSDINGAGQSITSSSTFDAEKNEVGFVNNATGDQSYHKQTSDVIMDNVKDRDNSNNRTQTKTETKDIITDENGNSSTTSQTASENKTYLKDKDGKNTNSTIDTAKGYDKTIQGKNGKTSTTQDELNITNTAKDGTITNDAQNIVNTATTMKTTVSGQATESYGGLDTTVNGTEKHTVNGKQINTVTEGQINNITGGQINKITGDQTTEVTNGNISNTATNITNEATEMLTDKVGDNTRVTTSTSITDTVGTKTNRKIEDGKITDTAGAFTVTTDKANGTTFAKTGSTAAYSTEAGAPTDTNIAGNLITTGRVEANELKVSDKDDHGNTADLSVEAGKGVKASAGNGTTTGSLDVTAEEVGSSVKDASGNRSTFKQRIDAIMGNVKNNTTGEESFHKQTSDIIMDNVKDQDNSNNRTQTKTETKDIITDKDGNSSTTSQTASKNKTYLKDKDGKNTNSTIDTAKGYDKTIKGENGETSTKQDAKDITNTAKGGTIKNDANDIVNNAQETITNKAGTSITNQVNNSRVTTDANGTTFENNTAAVSDGGTTKTKINGNLINTGLVDANELKVSDKEGDNSANLSVKAGEGVKASASDGTTTGSLDVTADKVGSSVKDASGNGSTFKQRIDAIMGNVKNNTTGEESFHKQTSDIIMDNVKDGDNSNNRTQTKTETKDIITDKDGNSSTTSQTASKNKAYLKDKDGKNTNSTIDTAKGYDKTIKGENGETSTQQTDSMVQSYVGKKDGSATNVTTNFANASANQVTENGQTSTVLNNKDGLLIQNTANGTSFTTADGTNTGTAQAWTNVKGNEISTGKVEANYAKMNYADVMKDLGVHGNAKIAGKTTTGSLEVTGTTTTKTLKVTENAEIDGTLKVAKKATFEDSVSIANDLSVGGDVTANSYKVGDKTYIDKNGIHANGQKITDVADGSISEGSKDAVNGGQLYTVKNDLEGKVNKVGANAAAMANLHPMEFDPDSKWNIAAAIGNYGSETAAALGAFYRPNDDVMVNLSTAFGTGENMVGGGVSVRLGKGGNKLSREETNALKAQVADLTARMDALLSVLNPNMSKDFPDVPENHWAYEAVSRLAGNDIVQGYPDGEFHGERTMTRYEMAEIIYNALSRGAEAEKELVEEFKPELQAMAASEKATAERAEG